MEVYDRSMDMISMMMQMERFPDFSEPFFPSSEQPPLISTTTTTPIPSNNNDPFVTNNTNIINNPIPQQLVTPHHNTTIINPNASSSSLGSEKKNSSMAAMREMIFRIAVMQPIHIDPEAIKPPKRRNVKISKDPQSVAARHRRERISERIRILQRLVPGGTKMDTASMLDEAIHYVKFLKKQVQTLEQAGANRATLGFGVPTNNNSFNNNNNYSNHNLLKDYNYYHQPSHQMMMPSSMPMLS